MAVLTGNSIISGRQAYYIMVWGGIYILYGSKILILSLLDLPAKHMVTLISGYASQCLITS